MPTGGRYATPHLALVTAHPGRTGGMETFCRFLVRSLATRNWRITIALSGENIYDDPNLQESNRIAVERVDWLDANFAGDRDYTWRTIGDRRRWFRRVRPDVALFVQSFNTPLRASVVGAFLAGVPIVTTHRTMAWPVEESPIGRHVFGLVPGLGLHRRRVVAKTWLTAALARFVVFNSHAVREGYVQLYRYPPNKARVVPNAVETPQDQQIKKAPCDERIVTIGYIGRVGREKRLDLLIRALAEVSRQRDCRLVIYGRGAEQPRLMELADTLGVTDRIEWRGVTDDTWAAYRQCDIVVLCSRRESSSNMILEAMAAARPVVVTRVGGLPELVEHGRCGLCVPPFEYKPLAAALLRLIDDETLRAELGARARHAALTRHDPERIAHQWDDLLREAARQRKTVPWPGTRRSYRNRLGWSIPSPIESPTAHLP